MDEEWNDDLSEMVGDWENGDVDPMEARGGRSRGSRAKVITLFRKRQLDYKFLGATTVTVVVKRAINVVPFFYYTLMLRTHARDIVNGSFNLRLRNTLPSNSDPAEFTDTANVLTLSVTQAAIVPLQIAKANDAGAYFKAFLDITQTTANNNLYAEISAVLLCRPLA